MAKGLRELKNASERRKSLVSKLKIKMDNISHFTFSEEEVAGKNIENLVGAIQMPLGIAGPIAIRHQSSAQTRHYIPLATTEGALVASVSRGCKAIVESGGATVTVHNAGITRGPVFKTRGVLHCVEVKRWMGENFGILKQACESTSSHLKLLKIESNFTGKNLFIKFHFDTDEAMGMNMATIATEKACQLIENNTGALCVSIAGNFDVDKKPSWMNFISGRGRMVWAEAVIKKRIAGKTLKTTPEKIAELNYRKCHLGSMMSGSMGFNAHFANVISAIFIATGQDSAHIVEGSLGITTAEVLGNGDLYFSIHLPSLIVGTVGGGTGLPAQKEALNITGTNSVLEFAGVIAGAVLAGELSLLASQAEGTLAKAHIKLGRRGKE